MPAPKKSPLPDARRDMEKELAAAGALKHQLREAFGEDSDLFRDMIEGSTDLDGAIDRLLEQMALDVANAQGIEKFQSTFAARHKRLCDRVETMRTMILNAADIVEVKRFTRPLATITVKDLAPGLLITDEAEIPTRFFKQPEPVLSRKELADALKSRRDTLGQKTDELDDRLAAGTINATERTAALGALHAAYPPIPGAELDNGSATIQVKWS